MHPWGDQFQADQGSRASHCLCAERLALSPQSPHSLPGLQLRAEALGAVLAAAAIVTPSIEERLKELQPGRGRLAAASSVAGATSVFALQPGLADGTKQVGVVWCGWL